MDDRRVQAVRVGEDERTWSDAGSCVASQHDYRVESQGSSNRSRTTANGDRQRKNQDDGKKNRCDLNSRMEHRLTNLLSNGNADCKADQTCTQCKQGSLGYEQ